MNFRIFPTLLIAGVTMLFSCTELPDKDNEEGDNGNQGEIGSSELVLLASDMVIQANGEDAVQFTVLSDGEPVSEGVRFYDGSTNKQIDLPDLRFTTTDTGTYYFWAAYGTSQTDIVTVTAIGFPVPELPDDPEPENTSFARRVLLTQFTGTGCGYCPGMITLLRSLMEDDEYASKVVLTACHSYNSDDPAYLLDRLDQAMGVSSYPMVVADMYVSYNNYNNMNGLMSVIDMAHGRSAAKAGISASAELNGNTLVVRASIKASQTSEFRIGAWLLEDGIEGRQSNYNPGTWTGNYDVHDNCIRIADSRVSNSNFTGHSLGTIEAGETAEYAFVMTLEDGWVAENCHLALFITTPEDGEDYFSVNNAVSCSINGEVSFDYLK
ncbi:MAG TPA: Omp28-related outer membrane protein [Candidatus Coprenecus merdigallinarum]|nr:Omp28-related outer membrane protein [Candidatus Coprenecus merdigallinarum]